MNFDESDAQQQPLPSYFPDPTLDAMFGHVDTSDMQITDENPIFNWNTPDDYYDYPFGISEGVQPNYLAPDAFHAPEEIPPHLEPNDETLQIPDVGIDPPDSHLTQRGYTNLQQWLEGTYRPPVPCTYCRRHRLQCLTIRTTSANPNPVTSCSSCVALFRECSLSRGEKRQPSGFETLSPVMGHLHGVTEHPEAGEDDPGSAGNTENRKESKQFVRKGARVLREWYYQNQEYPYPSEDEKSHLSQETGFSRKRISTWFANARRRQKHKIHSSTLPQVIRAGSPAPAKLASMTPMERWQSSPPEDEPVPESAIQNALASGPTELDACDPARVGATTTDAFSNPEEISSQFTTSASSLGSRTSDASSESAMSAWSYRSGESLPFPPLPRKPSANRGRRRQRQGDDENQYQCTFCTQTFKRKHDWYRHEKSVHLLLESWICTPNLNELEQPDPVAFECRFCDTILPANAHWDEHEFRLCSQKPVAERSFSRKDHLWQHLRKFHGCTKIPDIENWRGTGANVISRCGFCGSSLPTWRERADHLAEHFKSGSRMHQWTGDWGLDPSAMSILRNAVLPSERPAVHQPIDT